MRSRRTRTLAAGIGLITVATLVPATAAQAHHDTRTKLTLTVQERGAHKIKVKLRCDPPRGSHPQKRQACREIRQADGELWNLPGRHDLRCTNEYRPVRVKARGLAQGWNITYRETFGNWCQMLAATGSVFDVLEN